MYLSSAMHCQLFNKNITVNITISETVEEVYIAAIKVCNDAAFYQLISSSSSIEGNGYADIRNGWQIPRYHPLAVP